MAEADGAWGAVLRLPRRLVLPPRIPARTIGTLAAPTAVTELVLPNGAITGYPATSPFD